MSLTRRALPPAAPALVVAVTAVAAACGDGPTAAGDGAAGLYTLRSVDGVPVPASLAFSFGFVSIDGGQLLLRGDGRFGVGIASPSGGFADGTYVRRGNTATLSVAGGDALKAVVGGDSVVVRFRRSELAAGPDATIPYTFRRAPTPDVPAADGRWVLRTVDGRGPTADGFVTSDQTVPGSDTRFVSWVVYDTLEFRWGAFARRSVALRYANRSVSGSREPVEAVERNSAWAGVGGAPARLVLRPFTAGAGADTLTVAGDALVRRVATGAPGAFREHRYMRLP